MKPDERKLMSSCITSLCANLRDYIKDGYSNNEKVIDTEYHNRIKQCVVILSEGIQDSIPEDLLRENHTILNKI